MDACLHKGILGYSHAALTRVCKYLIKAKQYTILMEYVLYSGALVREARCGDCERGGKKRGREKGVSSEKPYIIRATTNREEGAEGANM